MNVAEILTRLCFSAPVLFIGILMVIDPDSFAGMSQSLEFTLRTFEQRLRGYPPVPPPPAEPVRGTARAGIRLAGIGVAFAAVAPLVLFVS